MHLAHRAAAAGCALLITGETGTGKGRLAEWIHRHSKRAHRPFVPVNCGAIPDTLIDSHLFGHARGSFSGAAVDHPGLVRAAEGGTLLLDEVASLPKSAQVRLLRLLQEREIHPVGYCRPVKVDVRIIAASNCDLHEAVKRGEFREDLFYRLDVVRLDLKPLRERLEEIPSLLAAFNVEFAELYGQAPLKFDAHSIRLLQAQRWPGNVRQLRTVVERLHVLCPDELITPVQLSRFGQVGEATSVRENPMVELKNARIEMVTQAIADANGSVTKAANSLGVHRSTLYRWLSGQGETT
jgi:DNA-binding NtrC family response regulator